MPPKASAGISHADAIACLQKVFAKNHSGFGSDSTDQNIDPGNLQYGEITYQGMQPLYSALDLGQGDVFYDLGCGVGKLVLYVALRGDASRSVGLEIGQRRFLLAEGARCSLDEDLLGLCLVSVACRGVFRRRLLEDSAQDGTLSRSPSKLPRSRICCRARHVRSHVPTLQGLLRGTSVVNVKGLLDVAIPCFGARFLACE